MRLINTRFIDFVPTRRRVVTQILTKSRRLRRDLAVALHSTAYRNPAKVRSLARSTKVFLLLNFPSLARSLASSSSFYIAGG